MKLTSYNKKRNFASTNEPQGKIKKQTSGNLKFVVQHHRARADHYDFRLEHDGVLLSWAVPKGVSMDPNDKRLAVHVEDHPLDYISFEGVIPKGNYGAGTVEIFDFGNYAPVFDFDYGLKKGHLKFVLNGNILKGEFSLVKIDEKNWLIIKSKDEFAQEENSKKIIKNSKNSSKNSKNNEKLVEKSQKIAKNLSKIKKIEKLPFKTCDVQLAKLTTKIPTGNDWFFEIKYDGYRILTFVENGTAKFLTRNKLDYTAKLAPLKSSILKIQATSFVLDGEVVAFDKFGRSDFSLLQQELKGDKNLAYVVFDILALDGKDLRTTPQIERKQILEKLLKNCAPNIIYSTHTTGNGEKCFSFAKKHKLEGIIAKKADAIYTGTRNGDWLKIKCYLQQEFVICGYTTTSKNQTLSALLLGVYNKDALSFVGKVGTGFNEQDKTMLRAKLDKIKTSKPNFELKTKERIVWVKPKLVAEIQYAELTRDKILRQPSFISLREDKPEKLVKLEIADEK